MKRGRLRRRVALSIDERLDRDAIRQAVYRRDGRRCQLEGVADAGPCAGQLSPHHRVKDGQQGAYSLDNLVTLCAIGHNQRLEGDADLAALCRRRGIVLRPWQDPTTVGFLTRDEPTPEEP